MEPWSLYTKTRDSCAGYMQSASRNGRRYVSEATNPNAEKREAENKKWLKGHYHFLLVRIPDLGEVLESLFLFLLLLLELE